MFSRRLTACGATTSIASMLVWMDLEMTGLDPARNAIVEIATVITDDDLEVLAEGPDLVIAPHRNSWTRWKTS